MDLTNVSLKEYGPDPHFISLVDSENTYSEKQYPLKKYNSSFMTPMTQLYVASLTVVGLFIIFRLSLAK